MAKACPSCGSGWLDAVYDLARVAPEWRAGLGVRELSLWRYEALLPIHRTHHELSMGEGWTPLTRLYPYEARYQHKGGIYVKDERAQPTNSFKDRQAALTVMGLKQAGIREIVLASTGNAGVAYAAYCARAGIRMWLFVTSLVPSEKMREAALYGCKVVKVSGTYDETKHVAAEFAQRQGLHFDRGAKSVLGKDSMKTLAFEIAEQLGLQTAGTGWRAPDWYIQAVSGGIGPLGVWKGFQELHAMGLIDKMPKLGIVQAAGCAPMVEAFQRGDRHATPVIPQTLITVLATGDPSKSYELLFDAVQSNGGTMLALEDGDTFTAMRQLASVGGLSVEPATAVAFGGLERMLSEGIITPDERVVVNCSGHTFSAEGHVLGDQYEQYVLEARQQGEEGKRIVPQLDGLGGALNQLDNNVKAIVLIDDSPDDRRLIRKLLRSNKRYIIYEADNGRDGMKAMHEHRPDLVILDLTLPDMDGLSILETIQRDQTLRDIPLIVYSARDLTHAEKDRLNNLKRVFVPKTGLDRKKFLATIEDELSE